MYNQYQFSYPFLAQPQNNVAKMEIDQQQKNYQFQYQQNVKNLADSLKIYDVFNNLYQDNQSFINNMQTVSMSFVYEGLTKFNNNLEYMFANSIYKYNSDQNNKFYVECLKIQNSPYADFLNNCVYAVRIRNR